MAKDVFDELADKLGLLPDVVKETYVQVVKDEIDKAATKLHTYFNNNCDSETLRNPKYQVIDNGTQMLNGKPYRYYAVVDWDDHTIANDIQRKTSIKHNRKYVRRRGQRDYQARPATIHDLAYIISHGDRNPDGSYRRLGNNFIKNGERRYKKPVHKKIEKTFNKELGKKIDELVEK